MNKSLQKQIKIYTGVASALLAADKANGQIVYVDVNPDTLIEASPANSGLHYYLLDIDNDGNNNFSFYVSYNIVAGTVQFIKVWPNDSVEIANTMTNIGSNSNSVAIPIKLNQGDTISYNSQKNLSYWCNHNWNNQVLTKKHTFNSYSSGCGQWYDFNNTHFLPFRIAKNFTYYYGWLRIKTLSHHSFIIEGYAYNSIPNAPIIAGDTTNASLSLNELNSGFQITQQNSNIHISSNQSLAHATVSVFDLLGKEILKQNFSGTQTEINIDKKGIYFVEVSGGDKVYRKKIFIAP